MRRLQIKGLQAALNEAEADADAAETLLDQVRQALAKLVEARDTAGGVEDGAGAPSAAEQLHAVKRLLAQVEAHLAASAMATATS